MARQPDPPYTFIGPDADRLIKAGLRAYTSPSSYNIAQPESFVADAGVANTAPPTPGGYPNFGASTPPTIYPRSVKERVPSLNLPTPGIDAAVLPEYAAPTTGLKAMATAPLQSAGWGYTSGFQTPVGPQPTASFSLKAPPGTPELAAAGREVPIPVGKYGWKGTSESINGQPTLVFGTPGTDGGGIGSWRPGSARVAGLPTTSARFSGSFDQPTGRMIEARSPVYDFGNSSTQTQTPIDFARMSRAERRFALANAKLDQGQQKLDTDAFQTQGVYDLGLRKLAVDQSQIDATAAANAGMPALRAAQAAEAEAKATAGLRLTAAADALKAAQPGTTQYNTALRDYLVLSGQGAALAKDPKQNIEKIAEKDEFGNTVRETLVQVNPDKTYTPLRSTAPEVATDAAFDAMIAADPRLSAKFKTLPPDQQAAQRKLFRDSQMQGK